MDITQPFEEKRSSIFDRCIDLFLKIAIQLSYAAVAIGYFIFSLLFLFAANLFPLLVGGLIMIVYAWINKKISPKLDGNAALRTRLSAIACCIPAAPAIYWFGGMFAQSVKGFILTALLMSHPR